MVCLGRSHERDRLTFLERSPCSSDPVHIVLVYHRHIKVDHMRHAANVNTAGGDIGRNQYPQVALFKFVHGVDACVLTFVGMYYPGGTQAFSLNETEYIVGIVTRTRKDHHPVKLLTVRQKILQQIDLRLKVGNMINGLFHTVCRRRLRCDFHL